VPHLSDQNIRGLGDILIEAAAALRRGDTNTYARRAREFYENIVEQSRNFALIEALARIALQVQVAR
jgi:DNA-binding GntR family transcriptional regulator